MTTTIFNLSAVDRIEALCNQIHSDNQSILQNIAAFSTAFNNFLTALGGGDQPSIDAATAALQQVTMTLTQAVARDQPPGVNQND